MAIRARPDASRCGLVVRPGGLIQRFETTAAVEHVGDRHPVGFDPIGTDGGSLERHGSEARLQIMARAPAMGRITDALTPAD
ncbi:hypothetical protein [Methylobacterium sp. DCY52]|jgi:hypothetical protein|uniref:hypothetical protein n=1 Tax=Methylobacterium sp. DCY52 TaxID=739139 RepID=UPI003145189E